MEGGLPYPGLRSFRRDESHLFFGREGCVDSMIERLAATRFLAVLGASGSGKSSLVRTGLLDGLELGFYARAGARWTVVDLHPGGQPMRNLASGLAAISHDHPQAVDVEVLRALIARGPRSIVNWCVSGGLKPGHNLLILIDQFEELFRYGDYAAREEAEAFVALLLESARATEAPIHVVLTMRSEYLGACSLIQGLAEQVNAGFYLTPRMNRDECRRAIEGPAAISGFSVEPALVNQVLNDMASFAPWEEQSGVQQSQILSRRADQLPLMQHLLNRLWLRARARSPGAAVSLTLDDYHAVRGLAGALDAHGAQIVASLGNWDLQDIETIFRALISGPDPTNAVRRPCRFDELVAEARGGAAAARRIVDAFRAADCNFLQPSDDVALRDDAVVDISHESLIRQWDVLAGWLRNEARADINWRRLAMGAERRAAGEGDLLTGLDLDSLVAWWSAEVPTPLWAARHGGRYEDVEHYLSDSREAARRTSKAAASRAARERKLLRTGVSVLGALFTISTALGISTWRAENQARDNARDDAQLLVDMDKIVYSNQYRDQLGLGPLQKDLADRMLPSLQRLDHSYPGVVSPAIPAKARYLLSRTFDTLGDAGAAAELRRSTLRDGFDALELLPRGSADAEDLVVTVLSTAYYHGWLLFNAGEDAAGDSVLEQMRTLAQQYDYAAAPAKLVLALARYERLRARRLHDLGNAGLEAVHDGLAAWLAQRTDAPQEDQGSLDTIRVISLRKIKTTGDAASPACQLSEELYRKQRLDRSRIIDVVGCRVQAARKAQSSGKAVESNALMVDGAMLLEHALAVEPNSSDLLMAQSELLLARADIALARHVPAAEAPRDPLSLVRPLNKFADRDEAQFRLDAAAVFVQALSGRRIFETTTEQARRLYEDIARVDLSKYPEYATVDAKITFFTRLKDAVQQSRAEFPRSPSYAFVAGDASAKIAELLIKDGRMDQAERMLADAIGAFTDGKTLERVLGFSEDTASVCRAWSQSVQLLSKRRRVDEAVMHYEEMSRRCKPALVDYPWDFYLRGVVKQAEEPLGKLLYDEKRFSAAIPLLQDASDWGAKESSQLLAEIYERGSSVPVDAQRATALRKLAERQSMKRFTIPVDFAGVKAPFDLYVMECAPGVGFDGIDDQITWVKEARGGVVPEEVINAFRKLHKIARDNDVSFPELVAYALGSADDKARTTKSQSAK